MLDNKNIQKVFGLADFRKKQLLGEVPQRTRESYREYGYFGGGINPAIPSISLSTIDRIDYSNDTSTASIRGPLQVTSYENGSCGNSNFGYFSGGIRLPPYYTNIQRIQYSNETTTLRGNINFGRRGTTGLGNNNFGYMCGGRSGIPTPIHSTVERIDYSNDLGNTSYRGPLTVVLYEVAATANADFGYIGGVPTVINRIDFSNDSATALNRGVFAINRIGQAPTGNSNYGYFSGGQPTIISSVERLDYSNDTVTPSIRGPLSESISGAGGTGNSNFGYISAGSGSNPSGKRATTNRIDYSNDTSVASIRGSSSTPRTNLQATSSHSFGGSPNSSFASDFTFPTVPNAGYFGGGINPASTPDVFATIDKVDYANDTATASVRSALSSAKYMMSTVSNSNFGYFGGGTPNPASTLVDRIEYSSDTQNVTIRGPLSLARRGSGTSSNSDYGWFLGGQNGPTYYSTVDRIDFSSDSSTASVRGLTLLNRGYSAGSGTKNYGWIAGGYGGPTPLSNQSSIERLDYSSDSSTLQRSFLLVGKHFISSTGNYNFGYWGGGNPGTSVVQRLDFSNDTTITSYRGPLNSINVGSSATGDSNFGYFGGGSSPSGRLSSVDRIDYSNDTTAISSRGPLSVAKNYFAATSPLGYGGAPIYFTNPLPEVLQKQIEFDVSNTLDLPFKRVLGSYGYFGADGTSRVDRVDYSTDLSISSIRGPLILSRILVATTGNSNFGYFGGSSPSNGPGSTIERINYSNDLAIASVRGPLRFTVVRATATGNSNFGYFVGGDRSFIDRLDYSNDSPSTSFRSTFNVGNRRESAATGNNNFGYVGGGDGQPVAPAAATLSSIERINYSNDISSTLFRGPLSLARISLRATGNSNFGYFGGGFATGLVSTVDRIDYANDTTTASVRGPLSSARNRGAATGNSNFGYFGGGGLSTVDRIDYSNDSTTASVRGPLSSAKGYLAATTNARSS